MSETKTIDSTVAQREEVARPSRAVARASRMPVVARTAGDTDPANLMYLYIAKGGTDVAFISQLVTLQERIDNITARKAFNLAIAAAKKDLPVIIKNRTVDYESSRPEAKNGKVNYVHEDLAQIAEQIDEVLAAHGLSYRFRTSQPTEARVAVTCIISHELGHSEENTLSAGIDVGAGKNHLQAVGSAVTYLSRYTLKPALGLAATADDDGRSAGEPTQETGQRGAPRASAAPRASQQQAATQVDTSKPHRLVTIHKETFAQWGERYVAAIKTANTVAEIEAWDRENDSVLQQMFNKNLPVYEEVDGAYERHKAMLLLKAPTAKPGSDPISTGRPTQVVTWGDNTAPDPDTHYNEYLKWVEDLLVNWSATDGNPGDLEEFWTACVENVRGVFPSDRDDLLGLYRKAEHRIGG